MYIALEELNHFWDEREVDEFDRLWKEGASIRFLCRHFNRSEVEVSVLILDRRLQKKIKVRDYGLWGGSYE